MIRALGSMNGKPTVILGLEPENIERLQQLMPISVNLKNLGDGQVTELPDIDVVIIFADEATKQKLQEAYHRGMIDGIEDALRYNHD